MRFRKLVPLSFHKIENVILRKYANQVNKYVIIFIVKLMCKCIIKK